MNGQQMIQQADDYVLLCDRSKVALTTRSRLYLDDSFWQQFVRSRKLFSREANIMLKDLALSLRWFDVTLIVKEHRNGDLIIRRGAIEFSFYVVHDKISSMVAMCELKDGQLCPVPIYSSTKCDTIFWEHLIDYWDNAYVRAVRYIYGFEAAGWPYLMFLLAHKLCNEGRYNDARDVFRCATARARAESDDELVAKFENLEQQLLAK